MKKYFSLIKQFKKDLRLFYLATAMQGFIFFGIYSLLLNLYLLRLGYGPKFIGTVNGVAPLVLAVGSLPAGLLSRRIGSRKGLIIGYFGIAIGFGLLPLSGFLLTDPAIQEAWIVGSYALAWLFAALLIVNYGPFIMEQTAEDERNHAFAIQSALFPVAGFVGSLAGGLLPGFFAQIANTTLDFPLPYRNALLLAAALYLIPTFIITRTAELNRKETDSNEQIKSRTKAPIRLMVIIAFISLLLVTGDWTIQLYLNVYLDTVLKVPTALIGSLLGAGRLLGLTAFLSPIVMGRFGHKKTLLWASIVSSLTFLPLILIGHWVAAGVSFMALIAVASILNPTYNRFSQSIVEPEWRTTIASVMSMSTGIAIAITAFEGSMLITRFGYQTLFITGALLMLLGGIVFGLVFREKEQPLKGMVTAATD
ncbi:MAG: MFS transporter [Anaerolineae bacterium]